MYFQCDHIEDDSRRSSDASRFDAIGYVRILVVYLPIRHASK